ncbi:MAG: glycosyltransferase family 39 protein, partial [Gemmatimonadetes bacterium]|nr:glycosyltransferase family 39 protein [Gemmatimonadota bacterium]
STSAPLELLRRYRGITALVAAAVFLRLSGLSEWWLNPDEGIYYSLITREGLGGFWQEVLSNAHPPLYYMLLRGLGGLTWDFSFFRAFSVLWGAVGVIGIWAAARRLTSGGGDETRTIMAGFIAAFIVAFAPVPVQMSQVMRPYAFQAALLAWALFFLLSQLRTPSTRHLAGYLTLTCLALLTHYSSVLALGVFGTLVLADGMGRGYGSAEWRRLAAWHVLPASLLLGLYFFHLRPLAASALADEALEGWLLPFMIRSPSDVWMSLLGFQHHLAGPWLRGPLALLLVAAVGFAGYRRDLQVLAVGGGAVLVAMVAAALGAYPFGSTRHSAWVAVFIVPVLAWFLATLLEWGSDAVRRRRVLLGLAGLVLLGGPIGTVIGADRARWAPTERVLREPYLQAMLPELDPAADPELMVMSDQTFNLLLPFYPAEREQAVFSADSSSFHFPYGERRILVSRTWAFLSLADGRPNTDLQSFLQRSDDDFEELGLRSRDRIMFVDGGWGLPVAVQIQQVAASGSPLVASSRVVPGLHSFVLRTDGLFANLP